MIDKTNDWKAWCRTCGKNYYTDHNSFIKCNSLDGNLLKMMGDLLKSNDCLIYENDQDSIICIDCHVFLKDLETFSKCCLTIHSMFNEITLDYEKFGDCDLAAVRCRYGLVDDDIQKTLSTENSDNSINNNDAITDLLKIEIKEEYDENDDTPLEKRLNVRKRKLQDSKKERKKLKASASAFKSSSVRLNNNNRTNKMNKNPNMEIVNTEADNNNVVVDDADDDDDVLGVNDLVKIENNSTNNINPIEAIIIEKNYMIKDNTAAADVIETDLLQVWDTDKQWSILRKEKPKLICELCNLEFKKQKLYEAHFRIKHTKNEWPNICTICSKHFSTKRNLKRHSALHSREKAKINNGPCVCEHCGKLCKSNSALKEHQAVHTDEQPFECSYCGRGFKNVRRLKVHIKFQHISDGHLLDCNICNKQFKSKLTLKQHMVVHFEQKKFKCNYCGNEYKRGKTLKTHLILHTGQKPYKCPFCDRTFADGSNCRKHKRIAHPIEFAKMEAAGEIQITTLPKLHLLQPK